MEWARVNGFFPAIWAAYLQRREIRSAGGDAQKHSEVIRLGARGGGGRLPASRRDPEPPPKYTRRHSFPSKDTLTSLSGVVSGVEII